MSFQNIAKTVQKVQKTVQKVQKPVKSCTDILKSGKSVGKTLVSLFRLLCCFGKSVPCVGGILAVSEGMLPDEDSKDVVLLLQNLTEEIKGVRHDVRELENKINWEAVKLQYSDIATIIETGMVYLSKILKSTGDERIRFEERIKELCSNQAMTLAVRNLVKGLAPGDDLLQNDILENIYRITSGHRGKVDSICSRFKDLFAGGLAVIAIYETLERGEEAASEMITLFEDDAKKLVMRFEAFCQRCKDCFRDNMLTDLNEVLDSRRSNKDAAAYLSEFLREKYDWLENYCIVCNESKFIDYDFSGDHVKSLERNDKFGVIFYRERKSLTSKTQNASILNQVREIVIQAVGNHCLFSDAAGRSRVLMDRLSKNNFNLWGCAVIKRIRVFFIIFLALAAEIPSSRALKSFEGSKTDETSEAAVVETDIGMHLLLISLD